MRRLRRFPTREGGACAAFVYSSRSSNDDKPHSNITTKQTPPLLLLIQLPRSPSLSLPLPLLPPPPPLSIFPSYRQSFSNLSFICICATGEDNNAAFSAFHDAFGGSKKKKDGDGYQNSKTMKTCGGDDADSFVVDQAEVANRQGARDARRTLTLMMRGDDGGAAARVEGEWSQAY